MKRPFFSQHERQALRRTIDVATGLSLCALSCGLLVALLTYNPHDPGFFSATWTKPTNALSLPGAYAADALMRLLGLGGYVPAALLGRWGWLLIARPDGRAPLRQFMVAPMAAAATAAFASAHATAAAHGGGLGGVVGDLLFGVLVDGLPFESQKLALILATLVILAATISLNLIAFGVGLDGAQTAVRSAAHTAAADVGEAWRRTSAPVRSVWRPSFGAWSDRARFWRAEPPLSRPPRAPGTDWDMDWRDAPVPPAPRQKPSPWRDADAMVAPAPADETHEPTPEEEPMRAPPPSWLGHIQLHERRSGEEAERDDAPPEPPRTAAQPPARDRDAPTPRSRRKAAPPPETAGGVPPLDLLAEPTEADRRHLTERELAERADRLQMVLEDYGVKGQVIDAHPGPVVTLFELEPAPGLKAARVVSLADDIARSMSSVSARISTVPGRNVIGIELPNEDRETVFLRELLADPAFAESDDPLTLALGKDIAGKPVMANLARMPHLLIAGTTGSGKSVAINTMLLSLLYRLSPEQVRLIMIDPKMLELSVYNDIPHLLAPVVTDPKKAVAALKWVVREMERRYEMMAKLNVRGLESYNQKVAEARRTGERFTRTVRTGFDDATDQPIYETQSFDPEPMPLIVVVVDEMADLMMVAGKEIEQCIQRLAQMARASGIHLIMATQRPSVDVITGTIKANFPIRISFQVTSKIDSRTILGEQGAEQLLGRGDMLYAAGGGRLTRIHGPFVSDDEVEDVVAHLKKLGPPDYRAQFDETPDGPSEGGGAAAVEAASDSLYDRAVAIVTQERRASTSFVQRRLQIGYNRAARIVEMMEEQGVVSAPNHVGKREVLAAADG